MRYRFFLFRKTRTAAVLCVLASFLLGMSELPGDDYERLDAATKRWLELEQKIASERNTWKAQKRILEQSALVLEADIAALMKRMERLEEESEFRAEELAENTDSFEEQEAARVFYVEKLNALAERFDRIRANAPFFLKDELEAARDKWDHTNPAALGERAQILVAAFTRIEEFNRSVSIDYQARAMSDGREVMVSILYWGLARGYAVDPQGNAAWELTPGEGGWVWKERDEYAARILELVDVHEQNRPPSIQVVPGAITNRLEGAP